ncbi:MAG TPA: hypothetical protein VGM05_34625 [Planctomycetaceae bacterium]|jgi:hypothetical protein
MARKKSKSGNEPRKTIKIDDAKTAERLSQDVAPLAEFAAEADLDTAYQFKITLLGSTPSIWRRIQVKDYARHAP